MSNIHPTAVIAEGATIASTAQIGAYCVIGPQVTIHDHVVLHSHVTVDGITEIGEGTKIHPFAVVGGPPQDKKYAGEPTRLTVGKHNIIREHVTMNTGTVGGGGITTVGDNGLFMAGAHVAHDCIIGNHVILANNVLAAGHVVIGDGAILGGGSAVHQFVRIGAYAMLGGMSGVEKDVVPYGMVKGERASLDGLNLVGLKRRNIDRVRIHALRHAFKELFGSDEGTLHERAATLKDKYADTPEAKALIDFVTTDTDRAFCTPRQKISLKDEA